MSMPRYAQDAVQGQGQGMMGGMFGGGFGNGLEGLLGSLFGHSGSPFGDAANEYQKYAQQGANVQNPFLNAGTGAIGNYQHWLQGMQDPTKFMNNMMGQYQESPWAKFQQQQGMRTANNLGSATGLTGSTPMMQQAQANAQNISSGDMNNWLQNVLGVNAQYGQGQQNLMQGGQNAANALTGLYGNMGANMGQMAYGKGAAQNNDWMSMLMGGLGMFGL